MPIEILKEPEEVKIFLKLCYLLAQEMAMRAIQKRDNYTYHHCRRVEQISLKLFGFYREKISQVYREEISKKIDAIESCLSMGTPIHDLGKLGWRDSVLISKRRFKGTTKTKIKDHPEEGTEVLYKALKGVIPNLPEKELEWMLCILCHHRNYNGQGYPILSDIKNDSLRGYIAPYVESLLKKSDDLLDSDPLRVMLGIVRLADSLDAATYPRPYKTPQEMYDLSQEKWEALAREIESKKGEEYHPGIVEVFLENRSELRRCLEGWRKIWQ